MPDFEDIRGGGRTGSEGLSRTDAGKDSAQEQQKERKTEVSDSHGYSERLGNLLASIDRIKSDPGLLKELDAGDLKELAGFVGNSVMLELINKSGGSGGAGSGSTGRGGLGSGGSGRDPEADTDKDPDDGASPESGLDDLGWYLADPGDSEVNLISPTVPARIDPAWLDKKNEGQRSLSSPVLKDRRH
ncbi:MAG: hypothetical protein Q4E57_09755 [Eubacteriales bacterium]|nr:hypothetical protein [Eubacteriales bacterium]